MLKCAPDARQDLLTLDTPITLVQVRLAAGTGKLYASEE